MELTGPPPAPSGLRPPRVSSAFDARRLVREGVLVMLGLEGLVVVLDVWLHWGGVVASPDLSAVFDATRESGLASWLAVTQASLLALTLWAMVGAYRRLGLPRATRAGWTVLAVFFTYLAVDDGTQLHERVGSAFADSGASATGVGGVFPSYYWQLVLGPAFAAMGLFLLVFLWRTLRSARLRLLTLGALALLALAVALDFVEGLNRAHPLNAYAHLAAAGGADALSFRLFSSPALDTVVHLAKVLEEAVEMAAMTTLWAVFLSHALTMLPAARGALSFTPAPGSPVEAPPADRARPETRRIRPRRAVEHAA